MLQCMALQRDGHNWRTELNWTNWEQRLINLIASGCWLATYNNTLLKWLLNSDLWLYIQRISSKEKQKCCPSKTKRKKTKRKKGKKSETIFNNVSSVQLLSRVRLLWAREWQHARPPCPSPTPRVHTYPCPLSWWYHPTISSSVIPSPPALHLSQHQGLFKWVSSSHQVAKVLEFQLQHQSFSEHSGLISFRMDWVDLLVVHGTLRVFSNTTVQKHQFFRAQLSL